jgi:protein-S-isoprenylcysteine O-methyltransferase Ste14
MELKIDGSCFYSFVLAGLVLAVHAGMTVLGMFIFSSQKRKDYFFSLPVIIQKLYVVVYAGPLFAAPLLPQAQLVVKWGFILYSVGALFVLYGVVLIALAFLKIGVVPSVRQKSNLVTTGAYGLVRHPIYSATLALFLGEILIFGAFASLIYFPLAVFLYHITVVAEEKDLVASYGDEYLEYKKKVRGRIIPFLL